MIAQPAGGVPDRDRVASGERAASGGQPEMAAGAIGWPAPPPSKDAELGWPGDLQEQ